MKIGLVLPSGPGYTETFFRSKIEGLQATGHQVIIFCSNNPENFNDCPVYLLPEKSPSKFKQIFRMWLEYLKLLPHFKTIRHYISLEREDGTTWSRIFKRIYNNAPMFKYKLDWLHFGFGTLVMDCQNVAAASNAKMAVSFRGFDIGVYPIKHPHCYQKLWDKVSKIHVISDDIAQLVYNQGFKGQVPLVKITPAINTSYFLGPEQKIESDLVRIVTVARLHWKKGLDYTLQALSLLKKEGALFEYTIIGAGFEEEALKFAVYQLGLKEQVLFKGKLDPKDVKKELLKSHIYLQYSVQEGFCNAVLEAQAMGLLCIVSDAEGLTENILDGQTGWVVPKRQPNLLASKIKDTLSLSKTKKQQIRDAAKLRVQQHFNIEKQQIEFIEFYKE